MLFGCTPLVRDDRNGSLEKNAIYTASFENIVSRVYLDDDLCAHWTAGDEISIFATTYNQKYRFSGNTGDINGSFEEVSGSFFSGSSIDANYAVYPYAESTSISTNGVISLVLPPVQYYAANSYGLGDNTMVAVTESASDRNLCFKNLCGYIVVRLYGEGKVKSITLRGNNDERISGPATVKPVFGVDPVITMSESATTTITLDCGGGVTLGNTPDEATAFWFAVPPVTLSRGFTIRVERDDSWAMEKTTFSDRQVVRRVRNMMAPLNVNYDIPFEGVIDFKDNNFKTYCVANYDTDGDGELSLDEAKVISVVDCPNANISCADELKFFTRLSFLNLSKNPLDSLNLSENRLLTRLDISNTNVTAINLQSNDLLKEASLKNCKSLQSVFVRGFEESVFPVMIVDGGHVFEALDSSTRSLPGFGHPLLIVPAGESLMAIALTDQIGIGYQSPIEGMHSPTLEEAQQFISQHSRYHDLLAYEGLSDIEDIAYMTSTPTGSTYLHEHTYKTGAYWTTRNYLFYHYYRFTLKGDVTTNGLVCAAPDTCPADLNVHRTGLYKF